MTVNNKDKYIKATRATRIENSKGPVLTTDEVAVSIQLDSDGDPSGFTSLTDTLENGLITSEEKTKLSNIAEGATKTDACLSFNTTSKTGILASGCTASGENSFSVGYQTLVSGNNSFAEGTGTNSSGSASHSEGSYTKASGENSHAEGYSTIASGRSSHVEGINADVAIDVSESISKTPLEYKRIVTSGSNSIELELYTSGTLPSVNTEYYNTVLNERFKVSTSSYTRSGYDYAFVYDIVLVTTATFTSDDIKNAASNFNLIEKTSIDVLGAIGIASHSEGFGTAALANYSHTEGCITYALNSSEHAQGQYNISTLDVTIDSVGIGTSNTDRKNAEETTVDGKKYIFGVGGYDGTNVTNSETKDLATLINELIDAKLTLDIENSNLVKTPKNPGTGLTAITSIIKITNNAYTALVTKDNNTLYIITDE